MKPIVLVYTTSYQPYFGGAEIALREIGRRLKDGFEFQIVTPRYSRANLPSETVHEGTIQRFGIGDSLDKWLLPIASLGHFLRTVRKAKDLGRKFLLWGMDTTQASFTAAWFKSLRSDLPFLLTIQYGGGDERVAKGRAGMIGSSFKFMLSRADHVVSISSYLTNSACDHGYAGPHSLIPNGVDLEVFLNPGALRSHPSKTVITTSRLVEKNGIDLLIQAMAELKKPYPDLRCRILGDGYLRPELERLTKELGLEESIEFLGDIPHDRIPAYLWEADIFVRPSRTEGMGNSFIEALAAGLPIIGTRVGGIPDIITEGKTGLFAEVEDPHDLEEKIKILLDDPNLARDLVENGRQMVSDSFTWEGIAARYRQLMTSLIEDR